MAEKKLIDFKNIEKVESYTGDAVLLPAKNVVRLIFSLENDIQIKMGGKNEWLAKDEIYITDYGKEIHIDSPFVSLFKIYTIKVNSRYKERLLNRRYLVKGEQRVLLSEIESENRKLLLNSKSEISENLVKSFFEQFFLLIMRDNLKIERMRKNTTTEDSTVSLVISYLKENIGNEIHFPQILKIAGMSSTGLKNLFKEYTGMGVMQYFNYLKIKKAKEMLLLGELNATQIANILGYESIHYFSRQFKMFTGVSPTKYINQMTSKS